MERLVMSDIFLLLIKQLFILGSCFVLSSTLVWVQKVTKYALLNEAAGFMACKNSTKSIEYKKCRLQRKEGTRYEF